MEDNYLFYNEYEAFYQMAKTSRAFRCFCQDAFGMDFSQDGFSDIHQINKIFDYIPKNKEICHILDIGCGNGKMLGYIQQKIPAFIYGFDYSRQAISTAKELFPHNSDFRNAVIGAIDYLPEKFDVIISMDTMYFAEDMNMFVKQINSWLKADGVFVVGYQEGDVVPKTQDSSSTKLAEALRVNHMPYSVEDITKESYEVLKRKYNCAMLHKDDFVKENNTQWFEMLIGQTEYANTNFDEFKANMARYIYAAKKADLTIEET